MKIVIIGSGIAGLTLGILLEKQGHEVVICERNTSGVSGGHAFLMHRDGLKILEDLCKGNPSIKIPGIATETFIHKNLSGEELKYMKMEGWQCMKRTELVAFLSALFPSKNIQWGRSFSHFEYENGKATAVVFENGDRETGDLFVAADGGNSKIREALFGKTKFTPVEVQEILGVVRNEKLTAEMKGCFTKYQSMRKGLSFGFIPLSDSEMIWFSQFDVKLAKQVHYHPCDLEGFLKEMLIEFPDIVYELIDQTDFTNSYLWQTKDFDPLPAFHKNNVVLIGDAAHLALPFTSAGTTNAIMDADQLVKSLAQYEHLDAAFEHYYQKRIFNVTEHVKLGRDLKYSFLHPETIPQDIQQIPLITEKESIKIKDESKPIIEIIYFTDPICSTCWSIQPELRKLKRDYGDDIKFRYVMAGLLPSWNNFNRNGIQKPQDVIAHWKEVATRSNMPMDETIWIHDPLASSYPPSIAFKAAQLQDIDKAILFIRRLNEIVFLQKGNIEKVDVIRKAAFEVGLDVARLLRDLERKAGSLFLKDLETAKYHKVEKLPTFIFKMQEIIYDRIDGAVTYAQLEKALLNIRPDLIKKDHQHPPQELFEQFLSLTKKEFKFLSDTEDEEASLILEHLVACGVAKECKNFAGSIWESQILPADVHEIVALHHPQV